MTNIGLFFLLVKLAFIMYFQLWILQSGIMLVHAGYNMVVSLYSDSRIVMLHTAHLAGNGTKVI